MFWKHWIISLSLLTTTSLALAQVDLAGQSENDRIDILVYKVPAAALLTERGQELAERLRQLRRIEATMGSRHPSQRGDGRDRGGDRAAQRLVARASVADGRSSLPAAFPAMNEHDLRQLILRLSAKVEQLELRVADLEKQKPGTP